MCECSPASEKRDQMLAAIPINRFAELEGVVESVLFLLSDGAGMISEVCLPINGSYGGIDAGLTLRVDSFALGAASWSKMHKAVRIGYIISEDVQRIKHDSNKNLY